ncbi:hypothetical protein ABXZ70_004299 [Salmonella enterica]|nr:hypothetical protein [Salmonella enterica]EAU2298506.1 hypothetical protein [Salmonella enterica]
MINDTLNALILRHGDNLLRRSGWPDSVDMTPVAPDTVPGRLAPAGKAGSSACGAANPAFRLRDDELLYQMF